MSLFFMLKKKRRWFLPTPKFIEPEYYILTSYTRDEILRLTEHHLHDFFSISIFYTLLILYRVGYFIPTSIIRKGSESAWSHSQADLDLIFSHINSYPRKERYGKSPIEEFTFYRPESEAILSALHIQCVDKDKIILNPALIKK